jgi:hypothetical protein
MLFLYFFATGLMQGQLNMTCFSASSTTAFASLETRNNSQQLVIKQPSSVILGNSSCCFKPSSNLKCSSTLEFFAYPPPLFYLQSAANSKKTLQLKKAKITLFVDESNPSFPTQISKFNTVECILDSMNGDSVVVTLLSEEIDSDYRNKYTNITTTYFGGSFNKVQKSIALKNIVYLQTRNPLRTSLSKAGTVLMGAAIVLIVGSPFAGMRQEGDARIAARERVFSAGLACFATSVPLFIFGKPKKYRISSRYKSRRSAYWNLLQH